MKPVLTLSLPEWINADHLRAIDAALSASGPAPAVLMVGGCVRNRVMGAAPTDIDLATIHPPADMIVRLEKAGIRVIPTGLAHGTVTAMLDGIAYEITTLRRDVETDGRHARVEYTDDWHADAQRRDFTINALYGDLAGGIYDPLGAGLDDAKARCVRFIGDAKARIREDYLRILRFFRFHAAYGSGPVDEAALAACVELRAGLLQLSRERVRDEMLKIISLDNCVDCLSVIIKNNLLSDLFDIDFVPGALNLLIDTQKNILNQIDKMDVACRFIYLFGRDEQVWEKNVDKLLLSNEIKRQVFSVLHLSTPSSIPDETGLKKLIYRHSFNVMANAMAAAMARRGQQDFDLTCRLRDLRSWPVPRLPVNGDDLMARNIKPGPELGRVLKSLEDMWVESGFTLTQGDLLAAMADIRG